MNVSTFNPRVTIALSTYNVAPYIEQAMDCILGQSMRDIEIICIDDASTDGTGDLLTHYSNLDTRIKLYRKAKNEGLAVSRNEALSLARGEYLIFVDGDDLMDLNLIEKAYTLAIDKDVDLVLWDYCRFYKESEIQNKKQVPSDLICVSSGDKIALLRRPAFTWVRLIRTEMARSLHIHFPEGLTKQDIPVHWLEITHIDRIALLPERLSYYRQQPNSTSNRRGKSVFALAYVMDIVGEQLKADSLSEQYLDEYYRQRLNLLYGMYDFIQPEYREEALEIIKHRLTEQAIGYLVSPNCNIRFRAKLFFRGLLGCRASKVAFVGIKYCRTIYRKLRS